MYRIEQFVEAGHWSIVFDIDERGRRRGRPRAEWVPAGGAWVVIGGQYATEEAAAEKIVQYALCGSYVKPKTFRVVWPVSGTRSTP